MQQDTASFWAEIKKFEEQLVASPDSYCFARLSDVYLKVGLVDDALHTAQKGVARHPGYLAGQRALAQACLAKGLLSECIIALKQVTDVMPEDVASQKVLGRLLAEQGDSVAAAQALQTVLEFSPDDIECKVELEAIMRSAGGAVAALDNDEEVIEELEIIEELDVIEEDEEFEAQYEVPVAVEPVAIAPAAADPLMTATMAEMYVTQGFTDKALEIYRAILEAEPLNAKAAERIAELENVTPIDAGVAADSFSYGDESAFEAPTDFNAYDSQVLSGGNMEAGQIPVSSPLQDLVTTTQIAPSTAVAAQGTSDNALATLDGWLENIRRIKSCR